MGGRYLLVYGTGILLLSVDWALFNLCFLQPDKAITTKWRHAEPKKITLRLSVGVIF